MPSADIALVAVVVSLALIFDFINGFHDTANAVAASISTRALRPRTAVVLAGLMNLLGALMFTGVAQTVGKEIANPFVLKDGLWIIASAMIAGIGWNLATWYYGLPSSSSHALIGSVAGAVLSSHGLGALHWSGFLRIIEWLILSPVLALVFGFAWMTSLLWLVRNVAPSRVTRGFRRVQVLSAAFQAFMHGTNDAQKTMGVITFALISAGYLQTAEIPLWVKLAAATSMALGTSVGGWRIIRTVGRGIMKMQPINGFASDLTSSLVLLWATIAKQPVSTTHVIASAVMGVGAAKGVAKVKWGVAGKIVSAWVVTLPVSALLAALVYQILALLIYIPR
ncbi:inorganic phosphate transporter [Kyrpidia spormannii]|uniref:Low-affinity inorganic phosphate transporter n=1 Tax=Kyrpidia spormannii TaxID=2055160 RepID=A0ACA8ZBP9_9BACL|nr:inorganic phosphate transporter [Kyrpidia spormannii]CAB3393793.1 putative low-affinity inorganic phosphate transporter [Kyrpidia spormannii]